MREITYVKAFTESLMQLMAEDDDVLVIGEDVGFYGGVFKAFDGLYKTYVRCDPDWSAILGGLGTQFPLLDLHGFKVWPACGYTRPTNTAGAISEKICPVSTSSSG